MNIITDIIIFGLPLRWLNTIKRTKPERRLLFGLFGFSLIGCAISIVRLPAVHIFTPSNDPSWNVFHLDVWSHIEVAVCIICGSAPALKPLFTTTNKTSETITGTLELSRSFYDLNRRSSAGKGGVDIDA